MGERNFIDNWILQTKRGVLPYAILLFFNDNEYYGYELIKTLKNHLQLDITDGTLYPILSRLQKDGILNYKWVEQESGIPRKYYLITDEGKEVVKLMKENWLSLGKKLNLLEENSK